MNLPNKLSLIRIILIPIIMIVYWIEPLRNQMVFDGAYHLSLANAIILVLAVAGALTDLFDGKYARKHNLVTDLGKFLDPLADKLLVVTLLIIVYDQSNYYATLYHFETGGEKLDLLVRWWMVLVILAREFMVTGVRLVAAAEGKVIAAGMSGKIKTTIQMITIVYILFADLIVSFGIPEAVSGIISNILVIASVVMTLYSGAEYMIQNKSLLNTNK